MYLFQMNKMLLRFITTYSFVIQNNLFSKQTQLFLTSIKVLNGHSTILKSRYTVFLRHFQYDCRYY